MQALISADVSVDDVLEAILSELDRNLAVDISAIWLMEDDDLYLAACHNCDENLLEATLYASPEYYEGMLRALYSEEPIIRKPSDPIGITGATAGFNPDYSGLAVPFRVGDQHLGIITLAHSTPGRYGHEAQAMTTTFASYAAVAIENARLYDSRLRPVMSISLVQPRLFDSPARAANCARRAMCMHDRLQRMTGAGDATI